jgi:RimJ/RimL family protein N-acetyltransferase
MRLVQSPLEGRFVRLEPYAASLKEEVRKALDCDAEAWSLFGSGSGQGEHFEAWWSRGLGQQAGGVAMPYAVRRLSDRRVVGTTSYIDIRRDHRGVEIGSTFYHPGARSGPVNPECKYLLLGHAFAAGALRVELVTDLRNVRSQAAIAKLGAVREGVLRKERVTWTGHVRDSVIYSITDDEWPGIAKRLEARLQAF